MKVNITGISTSLIGVHGNPPYRHANYFNATILSDGEVVSHNARFVNCWYENYVELQRMFGPLEVEIFEDNDYSYALVVDERAPDNYLIDEIYTVGSPTPSEKILQEMKDRLSD